MTRFPTETRQVEGVLDATLGKLEVGAMCAAPGCSHTAEPGGHHLFSRALMGGAFDWVRLPGGYIVGNKVPLCMDHHHLITVNKRKIVYDDAAFWWEDDPNYAEPVKLKFQPPLISPEPELTQESYMNEDEARHNVTEPVVEEHHHEEPVERAICPTCERPMPKPKIESDEEAPRLRKTWAVAVPADNQEDGADVLDELLEGIREKFESAGLSYGEGKKVKYFVLATALGLFLTNSDAILS